MDNATLSRNLTVLVLSGMFLTCSVMILYAETVEKQPVESVKIEGIELRRVPAHRQVMPPIREGLPDFESDGYAIELPEFYIAMQTVTFLDFKPFFEKYTLDRYSRPLPTPYEICLLLEYLNSNPPEGANRLPKGSYALPTLSQALSLFPSDDNRIDISGNPFCKFSDSAFMFASRYSPDINALDQQDGDPYSNWNGTRFEMLFFGYRSGFVSHKVRDDYLEHRKYNRDKVYGSLLSVSNSPTRFPIRLVYNREEK